MPESIIIMPNQFNPALFALNLLKSGVTILPAKDKRPAVEWKKFQHKPATPEEITAMFANTPAQYSLICGSGNGNVEVVDIDIKYDRTGSLYNDYFAMVEQYEPGLMGRLVTAKTVNNGYHLIYRCPVIEGNQKLAVNADGDAVMETRGQGGQIIIAPTAGYEVIQGSFERIPVIAEHERDVLLSAARSFHTPSAANAAPLPKVFAQRTDGELLPGDDFNARGDHYGLLVAHGWTFCGERSGTEYWRRPGKTNGAHSATFNYGGHGYFYPFSTNTPEPFTAGKGYSKFQLFALLECGRDFKKAARVLAQNGYGEKRSASAVRKSDTTAAAVVVNKETGEIAELPGGAFWKSAEPKNTTEKPRLIIDDMKLLRLIEKNGFFKFYPDATEQEPTLIRITNNIVSEITPENVQDFIRAFIEALPDRITEFHDREDLLLWFAKTGNKWFRREQLVKLRTAKPDFHTDTETQSFLYFQNCYVGVTAEGYTAYEYHELGNHCVWKNSIKKRDFHYELAGKTEESGGIYERFITNITGGMPGKKHELMSAIGFLLHRFKKQSYARAVVLADENLSENPQGRTGKGLALKVLQFYRNVTEENGKGFDLKNPFCYQKITLSTEIYLINDIRKWFDLEGLYSVITEGFSVEKKHQASFIIPFGNSPKIALSTNYTLNVSGDSARGRVAEFPLVKYYSSSFTPEDEFGGLLFSNEWSNEEWYRTDVFVIACLCVLFMNKGKMLTTANAVLEQKRITQHTSEEFTEWAEGFFAHPDSFNKDFAKDSLFGMFLETSETHKKQVERGLLKSNTFSKWVEMYCEFAGVRVEKKKAWIDKKAKNTLVFTKKNSQNK